MIKRLPEKEINGISSGYSANMNLDKAYKKPYRFTRDTFTSRINIFNHVLDRFKNKDNIRYLEIGVYEGGSMVWMLDNVLTSPSAKAFGIDSFRDNTQKKYISNLEISGSRRKVTTINGYSQIELRKLDLNSFDIIYIDGSHSAKDALEDVILSNRLLKKGGVLIIDDYGHGYNHETIEVAAAMDIFNHLYGDIFKLIQSKWLIIYEKK